MIETVSTSSVQSVALRSQPQASTSLRSAEPVSKTNDFFVSSRIRVDNLLDMAILEFRNSDSGDVIRQYPTESQIRGYQRAAELAAEEPPLSAETPPPAPSEGETVSSESAPAPAAPASASSVSSDTAPSPSSDGHSTAQSVVV